MHRYFFLVLLGFPLFPFPFLSAQEFPPLLTPVSSFGVAVAGDYGYVYGGHNGKTHHYSTEEVIGTFQRISLKEKKKWEVLPSGPIMQGLALVSHEGKIIRIGGMQPRNKKGEKEDNISLATCASYDPISRSWSPMPDLPEPRSSHDAVVIGDQLYVVGGWNMKGKGNKAQWYSAGLQMDLKSKNPKWIPFEQPFQRRALTAASFGEKVFVIGGMEGNDITRVVSIFDPRTGKWSEGPEIPGKDINGFTPASCVVGEHLFVSARDGSLSRLNEKGQAWEIVGKLHQPRVAHRMIGVGLDSLLVLGGASGPDMIGESELMSVSKKN